MYFPACESLLERATDARQDIERIVSEPSDRELCRRLDPRRPEEARAALAELYERHAAGVLSFLERMLPDPSAAEDALQETFLAAARHGLGLRGPNVRAWLLSIAANRARDVLRATRRREERQRRAPSPPTEAFDVELLDEELELALRKLPGRERAALELRYSQDLTHEEVARILGVSLRTAKSLAARGLERLRASLEGTEQ